LIHLTRYVPLNTKPGDIFFKIFLVCIVSDVARIQELFPLLGQIYFQSACWIIAILGALSNVQSRFVLKTLSRSAQFKMILSLFLWAIITIPTAIYPGNSFKVVTSIYWKSILLFVLIVAYSHYEDSISKMLWAFLSGAIILAVYAFMAPSIGRIEITNSYDANDLALVITIAIPYNLFCLMRSPWKLKILLALSVTILLIAVVRSGSRGGFLGLLSLVLISLYYMRRINFRYLMRALFVCLVGASAILTVAGAEYWNRMGTIMDPSEDYNVTNKTGRIPVWKRGIELIKTNPLFGVGIQNFSMAEGQLHWKQGGSGKWSSAHNSFIQIGAELGIPGLLAFCAIILSSLRVLERRVAVLVRKGSEEKCLFIASSLLASWAAFIVGGFFLSQAYSNSFYFLAGISLVCSTLEDAKSEADPFTANTSIKEGRKIAWQPD